MLQSGKDSEIEGNCEYKLYNYLLCSRGKKYRALVSSHFNLAIVQVKQEMCNARLGYSFKLGLNADCLNN